MTYEEQLAAWKAKADQFQAIRRAYRCGFISDRQFLDAKTEFEIASGELDLAEAMHIQTEIKSRRPL